MAISTIVIQYESKKTEEAIHQIILTNLDEMVMALGDNETLLGGLAIELKNKLALVENMIYASKVKRETAEYEAYIRKEKGK